MSTASDRNLLFGILAWQNSLISQDQLLGAMKAWTFDKNRTLAEILVSHQVLEEDRASRLERMVDDQIALHNDDPKQSLGVLSSVATVAKSLAAIEDSQLQLSLAHLAKADVSSSEATLGSVGAGTSEGRFKILRPHAKGALGQVSIARDVELNRDVALKEIQTAQAFDPQSQSRFLLEAEITGGLEHPGIVPVYGLGNYEDGRPYYAMRFIRGQSLEQAIREYHDKPGSEADKNLEFRGLLKRFVDVCEAMSYAHSRESCTETSNPATSCWGSTVRLWSWTGGSRRLSAAKSRQLKETPSPRRSIPKRKALWFRCQVLLLIKRWREKLLVRRPT